MFERFTDRSRKVYQLAQQEALRFNHEYVGTEHILLGLIKEGSGVAANVLKNFDMDLHKLRMEVEKCVQAGPDMVTMGKLPQTPRAKKVLEYAIEEARWLNHNYIGTEHILLGLMREQEGIAVQVLTNLGLTTELVREEVLNLLGHSADLKDLNDAHTGPPPERTSGMFVTNMPEVPDDVPVAMPSDKIADVMVLSQLEAIIKSKGRTPSRKILEDIQHLLNDYLRGPDLTEA